MILLSAVVLIGLGAWGGFEFAHWSLRQLHAGGFEGHECAACRQELEPPRFRAA